MNKWKDKDHMTIDVKLNVSEAVMAYLKREAERRAVGLDEVVSEVLTDYVNRMTASATTNDKFQNPLEVNRDESH